MSNTIEPKDILTFWFEEHSGEDWFGGKSEFDDKVRDRFGALVESAENSELYSWRNTWRGRLAEVIILDQFTRQLYRGSARAFASDALALSIAQEAVRQRLDVEMTPAQRHFLYMPYMHSESLTIHKEAHRLFSTLRDDLLDYEIKHREVLERFGRYPMRNEALGRKSTQEELDYMEGKKGSMF